MSTGGEVVRGEVVEKDGRGPVRMAEGRICSKPWEKATFSMDLKYCVHQPRFVFFQFRVSEERTDGEGKLGRKRTYLHSLDLQLQRSVFVHNNHRVGVKL